MSPILSELLGWLAFLQRPSVLAQLLLVAGLYLLLRQLPLLPLPPRWQRLAVPRLRPVLMLIGQGLLALLLGGLGHRYGLVLLLAQITLVWLLLHAAEQHLLVRWLPPSTRQSLVSRLLRPLFLLWVLMLLLSALGSLENLQTLSLGVWFGSEISLGRLAMVLVVLYLLIAAVDLPATAVSRLLQRSLNLSSGSRRAAEQILRYVLVSLGVVWAVTQLGINQTGLLAVAGGLSVGLGFGIKEIFSNIISGLWLLIEGSVRPGEVLMHQGDVCEVRRLGPRATVLLRGSDNAELVVPNQNFFTSSTTTYTRGNRLRRCSLTLSVPPGWPPHQVMELLADIARSHPGVMAVPAPEARLNGFGSDLYEYSLSFSIEHPLSAGKVTAGLRLAIWQRFNQLGMPSPS